MTNKVKNAKNAGVSFLVEAREFLADRRGPICFVGGDPSSLVLELASPTRTVTLVRPEPGVVAALRDALRERGLERKVLFDGRAYRDVSFEMSSFDGLVLLDPGDDVSNPREFFKKVKRELKTGGRFIGGFSVQRDEAGARGPVGLARRLERLAARVPRARVAQEPAQGLARAEVLAMCEKYLKVLGATYEAPLPALSAVALPGRVEAALRAHLAPGMRRLPFWNGLCTRLVLKAANERDFGTVFMKHVVME
jgi:SAM-dependent methyltransferase